MDPQAYYARLISNLQDAEKAISNSPSLGHVIGQASTAQDWISSGAVTIKSNLHQLGEFLGSEPEISHLKGHDEIEFFLDELLLNPEAVLNTLGNYFPGKDNALESEVSMKGQLKEILDNINIESTGLNVTYSNLKKTVRFEK